MLPKTCSITECERTSKTRGMCQPHYAAALRAGDISKLPVRSPEDRFWEKVIKSESCWNWVGGKDTGGYGQFRSGGQLYKSHRFIFINSVGPIPGHLVIDHTCRNRACVNPSHLRLVTPKQNAENQARRGRRSSSGTRGVIKAPRAGTWKARVIHNHQVFYLGTFETIAEAEAAVTAKRLELYTHNERDRIAA